MKSSSFIAIAITIPACIQKAGASSLDFETASTFTLSSDPVTNEPAPVIQAPDSQRIELEDGWYLAPTIGISYLSDVDVDGLHFAFEQGHTYGIGLGKKIENGFSLQLDFGHTVNKLDFLMTLDTATLIDANTFGLDFEVDQYRIMFSGVWMQPEGEVRPFIGAGMGMNKTEWMYTFSHLGQTYSSSATSDWAFSYQAIAGVDIELAPNCSLTVGYRFLRIEHPQLLVLENHAIEFGFTIRF